jgi:hypothetical protein
MRLVAAVFASLAFAAQTYPPPFPRPNATKLLENDRLVVWNVVWPGGEPSPLHEHVYDQVGTYYAPGGRVITDIKGQKRTSTTAVGAISTTRKGTLHIEEGTTDPPLRAVFIEMKHDTPSGLPDSTAARAPTPWRRDGAKQMLDTERVTIWDYTWRPGASFTFQYPRDTVTVWLDAGTLAWEGQSGSSTRIEAKAGAFRFDVRDTGGTATVIDGAPRAMIFEFK